MDERGQPRPPSTALTADTVHVAKQVTGDYYKGIKEDSRSFVKSHSRAKEKKMTADDFEMLTVIGRGAFGEVRLCRKKGEETVMAMKKMLKSRMIEKGHVKHVRAERDLMVEARQKGLYERISGWIVELYFSFQDEEFLYFVMEFCPGGDMMTWLIRLEIFQIEVARFYTAELVEAVQSIHAMKYAHRDLKPDNILLTRDGHIKLTDFGLAKQAPAVVRDAEAAEDPAAQIGRPGHSRTAFATTVGSPGYTAPEVLSGGGYGMECDWWSVGIILYEMLVGYAPFTGDENVHTSTKIVRWREYLEFPSGVDAIDPQAKDLIERLLCAPQDRLGYDGIRAHPFFHGLEWDKLRQTQPPLRINVQRPDDVQHFDDVPDTRPLAQRAPPSGQASAVNANRFLFSGFTSRLDRAPAASTRAGPQRATNPGIPSFDGMN